MRQRYVSLKIRKQPIAGACLECGAVVFSTDRHTMSDCLAFVKAERDRLRELEWLARDFVWSCPEIPNHPTANKLVAWFEEAREEHPAIEGLS